MSKSIYTAMSAARSRLRQLDAASDNLAKSATPGHRQTRLAFDAAMVGVGKVLRPQVPAQVRSGLVPSDSLRVDGGRARVSQREGAAIQTGRELDVLIRGEGYLATAGPRPLLSRDGRLRVAGNGRLELTGGQPVAVRNGTQTGPVFLPAGARPRIDPDGTLVDRGSVLGRLVLLKPAQVSQLRAVGEGLLDPGGATVECRKVEIQPGWLEGSNVDPMRALVEVIAAQRGFELAQQVVKASSALDSTSSRDLGKTS